MTGWTKQIKSVALLPVNDYFYRREEGVWVALRYLCCNRMHENTDVHLMTLLIQPNIQRSGIVTSPPPVSMEQKEEAQPNLLNPS